MKLDELVEVLIETAREVARPVEKQEVEEMIQELRIILSAATEEGDRARMVLNLLATKLDLAT